MAKFKGAFKAIRDFARVRFWAGSFSNDDSNHVPITHQQQVNVKVSTRVSLLGRGLRGVSKQWFQSFFSGLARMTLKRDSETGLVTATNVGGLSLAHNYLGDAEGYLSAARQLDEHAGQFSPKYFLLCHAIELALKAFILAMGGTEKETRKIKHDLTAAWSRAVALGLQPKNAEFSGIVERLAKPHKDYSFRYGKSWTHILPRSDLFEAAVSDLINDVTPTVMDCPVVLRIT